MKTSIRRALFFTLFIFALLLMTACGASGDGLNADEVFAGVSFDDVTANYNGNEHKVTISGNVPEGTQITYANNLATEEGEYLATATLKNGKVTKTFTAKLKINEPTAEQVVAARDNTVNSNEQGFDYKYELAGKLSVLGFETGEAKGIYLGQYRENKSTGDYVFKRTTSGILFLDSTKYAYNLGNQRVVLKMSDENSVRKIYVEGVDDQQGLFIHKPIEALVNNIGADEIKKISISSDVPGYKYKATLQFKTGNQYVDKLLSAVSMLDTKISLKDVEIPNFANGIQLYFNYDKGDKINDFYISADMSIDVKGVKTTIRLTYEQDGATDSITVPKDNSIVVDTTEISSKVQLINGALAELKGNDAYSIDVLAVNDFDPSWKISATVDKYFATLYKNGTDFNHSYEYKIHHEEDGAEAYKYTLGNVVGDDAGVYLVSRKGKNTVSEVEEILNADTQFDYLTSMALITSAHVDCIKVTENGDEVVYSIYLNKQSVLDIQEKILDIINSNDAEGVIKVNNYLNSEEYKFEEAVVVVKFNGNELSSIKCETEIRYNPTGGEYTEYNATLKNSIEIEVNKDLDKAEKYTSPTSTGTVLGIGASKYYIR